MNKHTINIRLIIILGFFCYQSYGQNPIKIQSETFTPKQLHKDIDYALEKFEQIHPDFFKETPENEVIRRFSELKSRITKPMTRYDFLNLFTPVAFTVIHDGHNFVFPLEEELNIYLKNGGGLFPIPVLIRDRKLFCNSLRSVIPYHSEITQINHKPVREIIDYILNGYTAESDEFEETANSKLFSTFYWQTFGGFDLYSVHYVPNGEVNEKKVLVMGLPVQQIDSIRISANADLEFEQLPDLNTAVFKYNSAFADLNKMRTFCDSIFEIIKEKEYSNLIIDVRNNIGGTTRANDLLFEYITDVPVSQLDSMETKISNERKKEYVDGNRKYRDWFRWYHYLYYPIYVRMDPGRKTVMTAKNGSFLSYSFPATKPKDNPLKFKGNLFLLTSKYTYSAANGLAAAFKCYRLGPIIGQETGQPLVSTADWVGFTLPNTKIKCTSSISKFCWACGIDNGHGVIPDYVIDNTISENYSDKEMIFVKEMIIKKSENN